MLRALIRSTDGDSGRVLAVYVSAARNGARDPRVQDACSVRVESPAGFLVRVKMLTSSCIYAWKHSARCGENPCGTCDERLGIHFRLPQPRDVYLCQASLSNH